MEDGRSHVTERPRQEEGMAIQGIFDPCAGHAGIVRRDYTAHPRPRHRVARKVEEHGQGRAILPIHAQQTSPAIDHTARMGSAGLSRHGVRPRRQPSIDVERGRPASQSQRDRFEVRRGLGDRRHHRLFQRSKKCRVGHHAQAVDRRGSAVRVARGEQKMSPGQPTRLGHATPNARRDVRHETENIDRADADARFALGENDGPCLQRVQDTMRPRRARVALQDMTGLGSEIGGTSGGKHRGRLSEGRGTWNSGLETQVAGSIIFVVFAEVVFVAPPSSPGFRAAFAHRTASSSLKSIEAKSLNRVRRGIVDH